MSHPCGKIRANLSCASQNFSSWASPWIPPNYSLKFHWIPIGFPIIPYHFPPPNPIHLFQLLRGVARRTLQHRLKAVLRLRPQSCVKITGTTQLRVKHSDLQKAWANPALLGPIESAKMDVISYDLLCLSLSNTLGWCPLCASHTFSSALQTRAFVNRSYLYVRTCIGSSLLLHSDVQWLSFFFQCPIQGRLELLRREHACLLRDRSVNPYSFPMYIYRDMRVEIIDIIDT